MSTTKLAEVVTLYAQNASDIPAMLRRAADRIESGEVPTKAIIAVSVDADGLRTIYGWGETDSIHSLATLTLATHQLAQQMVGDD